LLDVNFLVALFDSQHEHHKAARSWLGRNGDAGVSISAVKGAEAENLLAI
jgi:predicted nucleic acid-binding protein